MDNDYWYDCFLNILYEKYPKKTQLVQELMNVLSIEREATYRRLRKEVIFPLHEVVKVASAWNISLDQLVNSDFRKAPFMMSWANYLVPAKDEFLFMQDKIQFLDTIKDQTDTEYVEVSNVLPKALSTGFQTLYKFGLFKWAYKYRSDSGEEKTFSEIILPENIQNLLSKNFHGMKNVTSVNFICDNMLLEHLIHDIRYFYSIQMITDSEKHLLKQELFAMVDYLQKVVGSGYYPETGNKVMLYISQIHIETNYSFLYTENLGICRVHVFNKHEIYTYDTKIMDSFKKWVQFQKNSSILISAVDKKRRIDFFTKQRQLIDNL